MSDPSIFITLVHGTWGRRKLPFSGPLWFEEGSTFVASLKQALAPHAGVEIDAFLWSGKNSLNERADAGAALARRLWKQKMRFPNALQVVVGHSHGGSVALLGLGSWADVNHEVMLVTLATPFVEIVTRTAEEFRALSKRLVRHTSIAFAAIMMISTIYKYLADVVLPGFETTGLYMKAGLWAGLASYQLLSGAQNIYGVAKVKNAEKDDELGWLRPPPHRPEFYQKLTAGGLTIDPIRKVLILRGVDDEAGLAIAAGAIATRFTTFAIALTELGTRLILAMVVPIFLFFLLFQFVPAWDEWLRRHIEAIIHIADDGRFFYSLLFVTTGFISLPFLSGLFKSVYGRELLLGGYFCDIKSASAPDLNGFIRTITFPPGTAKGMRHGLYHHEMTVPEIKTFVLGSFDGRKLSDAASLTAEVR